MGKRGGMAFIPPFTRGTPPSCHPIAAGGARRGLRPGFTLAELMVSVAVLLVLMTMVAWIFSTATRASSVATASNELNAFARAAENQFGRDLDGLLKDSFIGIWYQLTEDPRYAGASPKRYLRTDRIVFFTAGDHSSIKQLRDQRSVRDWPSGQALIDPPGASGLLNPGPIRGSVAKVFLGHSYATDQTDTANANTDPRTWVLTRRSQVVTPDLDIVAVRHVLNSVVANSVQADQMEFELRGPDTWERLWLSPTSDSPLADLRPLVDLFGTDGNHGLMTEKPETYFDWLDFTGASTGIRYWGAMRRPVVNIKNNIGMHMLFLPGCAEFKVQRWIERWPTNGAALGPNSRYGMPRWWPEEDPDGNGIPHETDSSDFPFVSSLSSNTVNIREYFNGPFPPGGDPPRYPSDPTTGAPWLYFSADDVPRAIKITIRLFDQNQRIADGQVFTMTFGLR
ncbi:MAG TPA: prepilin-type N-terminal cleavage/methylation domain-containing protein [Phycisphaerae bacterium]|nr:prepilin-type N-terminal cleavage/methylation domain-containing protein [Phycisphaerae bacterium]